MRKYLALFFIIPTLAISQGKFFGGDAPPHYNGADLVISVLHVDYDHIHTKVNSGGIVLNWQTSSERTNDYFQVEKLMHEKWGVIGKVDGKGTTSHISNYTFKDPVPSLGGNYYRLRQVDFDGAFHLSKIVKAVYLENKPIVFPNPTNGSLHISHIPAHTTFELYDMNGRLQKKGTPKVNLDLSNMEDGHYILILHILTTHLTYHIHKH